MGAPQNRLYEMMRGLKACGNNVFIVTAMPNYPTGKIFQDYRGKFSVCELVDEIEVKRYWLYASNARKIVPRLWNMISFTCTSLFAIKYLKAKELDYLIVESPPLTLAWTGKWIAKAIGAKYISNISDLWPLSAKELGAISEGKLYDLLLMLERNIYSHSDMVMGQSEEIVEYIKNHGGKSTYLFRNGVDPARFDLSKKNIRVSSNPIKIVYAGLLGYAQGIADICSAVNFKQLGAEFHIYGAGGEKEKIEKYLKENNDKGIYYHGVIPREDLPQVLINSDMSLIPLVKNIYGAVPSKIYESMAAGLPIMFMGEGEGAKIIKENNLGLIAPSKDYRKLQENIMYAVSHPGELAEMSINCVQSACNKFNRSKQISALNDFLRANL